MLDDTEIEPKTEALELSNGVDKTKNQLRIELNYERKSEDVTAQCRNCGSTQDQRMSDSELTEFYINLAVGSVNPKGIKGQQRRTFGRIQRKVSRAIKNGESFIVLESAEKTLLKKAFDDCEVPSAMSQYFMVLEIEIDEVCKE